MLTNFTVALLMLMIVIMLMIMIVYLHGLVNMFVYKIFHDHFLISGG